jgi:hypothetical protein
MRWLILFLSFSLLCVLIVWGVMFSAFAALLEWITEPFQ